MKDTIKITIIHNNNHKQQLEAPVNLGLNLMEFLKANGYPILATCGGIALCATCHVQILKNYEQLSKEISDEELAMLDTLPEVFPNSRLACQIKLTENTPDIEIRICSETKE